MSATCARILIVDDHAVVRQGVRSILESNAQWQICGEAKKRTRGRRTGKETASGRDRHGRDDAREEWAGRRARDLTTPTGMQSAAVHDARVKTLADFAQQSGARGVLVKTRAPHDLVEALECVLAGGTFFRTSAGAAKLTHRR